MVEFPWVAHNLDLIANDEVKHYFLAETFQKKK